VTKVLGWLIFLAALMLGSGYLGNELHNNEIGGGVFLAVLVVIVIAKLRPSRS
jgi:hypothetical protein